jgi:hypothetical protein
VHAGLEPGVRRGGQLQQPVVTVAPAGDGGIDVEKVSSERASVQRAHLVRDRIVGVAHRTDIERHRRVGPPVG